MLHCGILDGMHSPHGPTPWLSLCLWNIRLSPSYVVEWALCLALSPNGEGGGQGGKNMKCGVIFASCWVFGFTEVATPLKVPTSYLWKGMIWMTVTQSWGPCEIAHVSIFFFCYAGAPTRCIGHASEASALPLSFTSSPVHITYFSYVVFYLYLGDRL